MTNEVWGAADLHTHPAAHLGFGGVVGKRQLFFGEPLGPIDQALPCCHAAHDVLPAGTIVPLLIDHTSRGMDGSTSFNGWPSCDTILHQQMHIESIHRAFLGGMRLMVASAVNNEYLANMYQGSAVDVGDDPAIQRQLDYIKQMVAANATWMRIVTTAQDARDTVGSGMLAIVLGIEVDSIAGSTARRPEDFNRHDVEVRLDRWFQQGVRLINVVHLADNVFAGCAMYDDRFNLSNHSLFVRHHISPPRFWEVDTAPEIDGVRFLLGQNPDNKLFIGLYNAPYPDYLSVRTDGHANARGLSEGGTTMLQLMMARGMMIDVDHMSQRAVNGAIDLATANGYPLVSSHTGFRDLAVARPNNVTYVPGVAHEGNKTDATIRRLPPKSIVGIVSHLGQVAASPTADTSASWAAAYKHAIDDLGLDGVAIGTDFNGFGKQPGPRGGGAVRYDGTQTAPGSTSAITKSIMGLRQFDINIDGLAHYGMLPDFVLDVSLQYGADGLAAFFRSAEKFIQGWEAAEEIAPGIQVPA